MPKFDARTMDQEWAKDRYWPVLWIYGPETMKARECVQRLHAKLVESGRLISMNQESYDATETAPETIVDAAHTMAFGGGVRWIDVHQAHKFTHKSNEPSPLLTLLENPVSWDALTHVCVFRAKDLDLRTKWSKQLSEKAALFPCDPIAEQDRQAWVALLMKRLGLDPAMRPDARRLLSELDPWSLDRVNHELDKWIVDPEAEVAGVGVGPDGDALLRAILAGRKQEALERITEWSDIHANQEGSHLLTGLIAWHLRAKSGGQTLSLLKQLVALDEDLKTTFRSSKAAWRAFVLSL